jgi:hypothetical protein
MTNAVVVGRSKRKIMPASGARLVRPMSPRSRSAELSATSTASVTILVAVEDDRRGLLLTLRAAARDGE